MPDEQSEWIDEAERPEWHRLLKSNCTLNILRYAGAAGTEHGFDLRHYLNGWAYRYLYGAGFLNTALPFGALRMQSRINDAARFAKDAGNFSTHVRRMLQADRAG